LLGLVVLGWGWGGRVHQLGVAVASNKDFQIAEKIHLNISHL